MRQVMPHRNNIVADRRRCKCFLRPVDRQTPKFGALLHSCLNASYSDENRQ